MGSSSADSSLARTQSKTLSCAADRAANDSSAAPSQYSFFIDASTLLKRGEEASHNGIRTWAVTLVTSGKPIASKRLSESSAPAVPTASGCDHLGTMVHWYT